MNNITPYTGIIISIIIYRTIMSYIVLWVMRKPHLVYNPRKVVSGKLLAKTTLVSVYTNLKQIDNLSSLGP